MKYSILGFNQQKVIDYTVTDNGKNLKCDLADLLILNYIIYAQSNVNMRHILDEDGHPCVWLQHKHLLEDLPILNMSDGSLRNRLTKLRKMGLIESKTNSNESQQGTKTYYRTTSFLNDMLFETTSFKNDMLDRPRHFKMTSDNKVYIDNKVNNNSNYEQYEQLTIFKPANQTSSEPAQANKQGESQHELASETEKPKKPNLYSKCLASIEEFTESEGLRKLLETYLAYRLEIKDKPIYTNQWKGMLKKLASLCDDRGLQSATEREAYQREIVQQSINRGYLGFFEVKEFANSGSYKSSNKFGESYGVHSCSYTEAEKEQLHELNERRAQNGERTIF